MCSAQLSLGGSWFQAGLLNIDVKTLKANTADLLVSATPNLKEEVCPCVLQLVVLFSQWDKLVWNLFCVPEPNDIHSMSKNSNQIVATDEMLNAH